MRLWVTGLGLVTPLGLDVPTTWAGLVRGDRGIGPITHFAMQVAGGGYRSTIGAEVKGLPPRPCPGGGEDFRGGPWSRTAELAERAAREAMHAAGLEASPRVGLVVGGTTGGMLENEVLLAGTYADPSRRPELAGLLTQALWATGDRLHETLGPFGRVRALSSACSSGANALVVAAMWLLAGDLDAVVAGGTDGLCRLTFTGFNALAAIDPSPCRPFDVRRRGLNLGEGAGFLVLERDDRARARGAAPIAELAGWSLAAEAHHITNPEASGATAARVMRGALAKARLSPRDVDFVSAHGTGTPLNDPMEASAIAQALGPDETARVAVASSKGQIGHTLGAAGAIEAAVAALVVARQMLVPTAGLEEIDPACRALNHVLRVGRPARVRAAMSNAFGFGGMDTALVLTEPELAPPHNVGRRRVVVTAAASLTPSGLLGTRDSAKVLEPHVAGAPRTVPPTEPLLDADRARRLDEPARFGAVVMKRALEEARGLAPASCGAILGSTFGSIDATAAFMHRVLAKGPRFASPAEFPNLVPSSPVGHVSIYLGLRGPVMASAELGATGECSVVQAVELVGGGEAEALIAGDVEEANGIVDRVFGALVAVDSRVPIVKRCEGGAAIVVEAEDAAAARGAEVIAYVALAASWREGGAIPAFPAPRDVRAAEVIAPRAAAEVDARIAGTAWARVKRTALEGSGGEHEALGAIAIAAAVSRIARGEVRDVLVVGLARGRGYALVLSAP